MSIKAKLFLVVATVGVSVTAYAYLASRPKHIPPDPPLQVAWMRATQKLGQETNRFHCVLASAISLSEGLGNTEWHFIFYSPSNEVREVVVGTKPEIIVRTTPRSHY